MLRGLGWGWVKEVGQLLRGLLESAGKFLVLTQLQQREYYAGQHSICDETDDRYPDGPQGGRVVKRLPNRYHHRHQLPD